MGTINKKKLIYIAIIASLLASIADVLLLYHTEGNYMSSNYQFLRDIPAWRLRWGYYLGVFAIPFELVGLWPVYTYLKGAGKKLSVLIISLAIFIVFPGIAYHALLAATAYSLQEGYTALPSLKNLFEPLGVIIITGFVVVSVLFSYSVLFKNTLYKKWIAFCSPMAFYLLWLLLYLLVPVIGNIFVVAGFNLSMALFFTCVLWAKKQA